MTEPDALAGPLERARRRRRAARPGGPRLPAAPASPDRLGDHRRPTPPRRCGGCGTASFDAVFLDIRMPGPRRPGAGPGASAASPGRPRSSSSPPSSSTPSRPSSCRRSTTCSSRCGPSACPTPSAGSARRPAAPAAGDGEDSTRIAVETGGPHPDDRAGLDPLRGGQRRLRPPPHRRRRLPRPHADLGPGGDAGATPASSGSTADTSWPSATSPSCGPGPAAATSCWWPARSCRSAGATPGSCGTCCPGAPAPQAGTERDPSQVTETPAAPGIPTRSWPPARHRPQPAGPGHPADAPGERALAELAEQTEVGEVLLRSLIRAQLMLAVRIFAVFGFFLLGLPALFATYPGLADFRVLGLPLPWLLLGGRRLSRCSCSSACSTSARPSATSATSSSSSSGQLSGRRRSRWRAVVAVDRRHHRHRRLRHAGRPDHVRLLRRLPDRPADVERLGHLRRVPVGGLVPRRGRAGHEVRRRHAVVSGRLRRRLPGPAPARRRPAAPLRRLHHPRLRRRPARLAGGAPPGHRLRAAHRLVLPAAPAEGRRRHAAGDPRHALLGRRRRSSAPSSPPTWPSAG